MEKEGRKGRRKRTRVVIQGDKVKAGDRLGNSRE